jgi:hypothetical protein
MRACKYLFATLLLTYALSSSAAALESSKPLQVINNSSAEIKVTLNHSDGSSQSKMVTGKGKRVVIRPKTDTYSASVCWVAHNRSNSCKCNVEVCPELSPTFIMATGTLDTCPTSQLKIECKFMHQSNRQ